MLKEAFKRALLLVTAPLRFVIRHELRTMLLSDDTRPVENIGLELQRGATASTAAYVADHMKGVDSVSSNLELLTRAVAAARLTERDLVCEFGVFSGNTINHIASLAPGRVYGFDSFEGLPERWRDGFRRGHFRVDGLPVVRPNVELVKGWFDETLPRFVAEHDGPVGLLHVDCDLYSSTRTVLEQLGDRLRPGSVIVFDEYFNYPGWEEGEYRAFQEFVRERGVDYEYIGYNRLHQQVAVVIRGMAPGDRPEASSS